MSVAADLINDAREYSSETLASAIVEMGSAMNILQGLGGLSTKPLFPPFNIKPPDPGDPGLVPNYQGQHLIPDAFTTQSPFLLSVPELVLPQDPALPVADLVYIDPRLPTGGDPNEALLADVPVTGTFSFPVAPDLEGEIKTIIAPALIAIDIPDAPTFQAPEFLGVRPTFDTPMPTNLDTTLRTNYEAINPVMREAVSSQIDAFLDREFPAFRTGMAAIEARLQTYLAGGSALTPAIENAIYNRTLDKTNADARRARQTAIAKSAQAGFTMFGPELLSQLQDIDQDRRNNNARASTDIAIEQAKLEQANLQFAVTQSGNLRQMAMTASMSYYNGLVTINGQAIEYARSIVDSIVKAYEIAARFAETQARLYEADAVVYRAKLEGALAVIQAYEATIRGLQAKAEVNRVEIEAYRARLEAVQAEANVYRAAVDAVVAQAGLERIKVDLYGAKVQAYTAQVNAKTAQWIGYKAAVEGQASRMEVNVAHAREYEARTNGYVALVRGKTAAVEAAIATNKGLIDNFRAQVEAYGILQHAKAEAVSIDVNIYDASLKAFVAKATAIAEHARAEVANFEVELRGLIATAEVYMEQLRETHKLDIARVTGEAQVAVSAGQVYSGIAQAALSGMNSLAAEVVSAAT